MVLIDVVAALVIVGVMLMALGGVVAIGIRALQSPKTEEELKIAIRVVREFSDADPVSFGNVLGVLEQNVADQKPLQHRRIYGG